MRITDEIKMELEQAAQGIDFGTVTFTLFIKPMSLRYTIAREISRIYNEALSTGNDFIPKSVFCFESKGDNYAKN